MPTHRKRISISSLRNPPSTRAQLLLTPSLHKKVAKKAASLNMSFNELVNAVLEKFVQ